MGPGRSSPGAFARRASTTDLTPGGAYSAGSATAGWFASLELVDLDGDRDLDLVVLGRTTQTTPGENEGRGSFANTLRQPGAAR